MSSRDSHIHDDIRKLLHKESLTPEMERAISVLGGMRPRVDINRDYQKKLRAKLMQGGVFTPIRWTLYIPAVSGVFAVCIVVLGYMRLLTPIAPVSDMHTPLTVEAPMMTVATEGDTVAPSVIDTITPEDRITDAPVVQSRTPEVDPAPPSETVPPDTPVAMMMLTPESTPAPSAQRESTPKMAPDAAMSDLGYMSMTSEMTTTEPLPPEDTSLQDEMTLMIHDINTILADSTRMSSITLPVYPATMLIYEKSTVFTEGELRAPEQYGLTARTVTTIQDASAIKQKILSLAGDASLTSSGSIIYTPHIRGDIFLLVPSLSYTLTSGAIISVPVVSGY